MEKSLSAPLTARKMEYIENTHGDNTCVLNSGHPTLIQKYCSNQTLMFKSAFRPKTSLCKRHDFIENEQAGTTA